jgi:hypothetical protein
MRQKWRTNNMLILPIKKKWYDMIHSGEKKEEYRKLSPYYEVRFKNLWQGSLIGFAAKRHIIFRNGYSRKSPSFIATVTLDIGEGRTEWGAKKGKNYYILKIHSIDELPYWIGKNCKDCGNEKCKKLGKLPKGHDCALWQPESEDKK